MSTPFSHTSVLLFECIEALNIRNGYTYVDCTVGGGGHSYEIAKRMGPDSRLICFDQDERALAAASERLSEFSDRVTFIYDNFQNLDAHLTRLGINNVAGVLADLGCSSPQFDDPTRGFSYMHDARLDMRMNTDSALDAYEVVNTYSEDELRHILYTYGEERFAPRIAAAICKRRAQKPIETTHELSELIKGAIPPANREGGSHPAKRSFQAIRIEVNRELDVIAPLIKAAAKHAVSGGRIAIISFHSLEDRLVKEGFRDLSQGCTCPRDFPVCVCGKKPLIRTVNKKPILPTEEDINTNPRARSAKLRIAEKL